MYSDLKLLRTSNFGWAHPNRVVSQAVFQNFAAGHPKLEAEREVRASPWFGSSKLSQKTFLQKKTSEKVRAGWRQGFCWYERAGERPERTQAVGLKD
jgi:hypothetical protein